MDVKKGDREAYCAISKIYKDLRSVGKEREKGGREGALREKVRGISMDQTNGHPLFILPH